LSNKGMVIIRGEKYPIVGNVCMDMTMCKIGNNSEVQLDDDVTIIGRDGDETITADDHADWINTINYEVLTGISVRVPRLYFKNGQLVGQDGPNGYIAINNV
ncbi:MAG: alanine racemase C-terminal domain-containing protein, partial [bacterium]